MPKKELDLSFLIQPVEEFELPSRGLHYKDSILKKGKLHCRPWVSTDEKLIDKFNRGNFYDILKRLVKNVLEEKIDVDELTTGDFFYLLNMIRSISYGSVYMIKRTCPSCDSNITVPVDLYDFPIKFLEDESKEPFEVTLPKSGIIIKYRLPRLRDSIEATEKSQFEAKRLGVSISPDSYKMVRCIEEMTLPNKENTILTQKDDFAVMLHKIWPIIQGIDILKFRSEIDKHDHGVVENIEIKCPECESKFEQGPVLTYEFFRPSSGGSELNS
ncbi:MAG: hypothetical protein GX638_12575 [Crenarchaeota archaeon]|nr:hypothetical protein [Thermoproteota archaeon]